MSVRTETESLYYEIGEDKGWQDNECEARHCDNCDCDIYCGEIYYDVDGNDYCKDCIYNFALNDLNKNSKNQVDFNAKIPHSFYEYLICKACKAYENEEKEPYLNAYAMLNFVINDEDLLEDSYVWVEILRDVCNIPYFKNNIIAILNDNYYYNELIEAYADYMNYELKINE